MPLGAGTRLGPYEIQSAIGAGGMGEVYKARDTKLDRLVAIKVLSNAVVNDPDRIARFEREAKTLAALNHPHIAQIYGVEDSGATRGLVMEFGEGETLADRIARGRVPLDEALPIARQAAEALAAAHGQRVIHRDLKPSNIKVRSDGTVKVLDFGLAKLNEPSGPNDPNALSMSPTVTSPALMTGVGVLLGTAAYMAPEQARGRPIDYRADIWAYGCVLFEMLAGARPFAGADVAEVLAAVIKSDVEWSRLPAATPAAVRRLLNRALQKDPEKRLHDIRDACLELDDVAAEHESPSVPQVVHSVRSSSVRIAAAGLLIGAAFAGVASWFYFSRNSSTTAPVTRLVVALQAGNELSDTNDQLLNISPDGRWLA